MSRMSVPYVNSKSAEAIRDFEARFAALPRHVGVVFVSVVALPVEGGESPEFWVRLGLTKNLTTDAGNAIIHSVLKRELEAGLVVRGAVYFGIPGAAGDASHEGAHSAPT